MVWFHFVVTLTLRFKSISICQQVSRSLPYGKGFCFEIYFILTTSLLGLVGSGIHLSIRKGLPMQTSTLDMFWDTEHIHSLGMKWHIYLCRDSPCARMIQNRDEGISGILVCISLQISDDRQCFWNEQLLLFFKHPLLISKAAIIAPKEQAVACISTHLELYKCKQAVIDIFDTVPA